ncbi:MAG TPA: hypothetical protein VG206_01460 [Terriglobia bacterium]|nr:hypothetical protein [Terriglobia bacterium]
MSTQEYSAILGRLDSLERQVRWRSVERLLALALISWLLTSGPAAPSLRECWQSLRLRCTAANLRAALDWSLAGIRDLATVRPALDPKTVVEDERESSQETARPAFPRAEAVGVVDPTARAPFAVGQCLSGGAVSRRSPSSRRDSPAPAPAVPSVTSRQSQPGLDASIREAERTLARASESAPKVAEIGSGLPPLITKTGKGPGFDRSVLATLPAMPGDIGLGPASESQISPAQPASAPNGAPALSSVDAAPTVALKALGYAQSVEGAQAILTDGTTLYVVNEGEEFADRFRVTGISPQGLDIEDRRTNTTFQLEFGH